MQGPVKKFPLLRQDAVDSDNSDSVVPEAEPENTSNNMINPELIKDMQPIRKLLSVNLQPISKLLSVNLQDLLIGAYSGLLVLDHMLST